MWCFDPSDQLLRQISSHSATWEILWNAEAMRVIGKVDLKFLLLPNTTERNIGHMT